MPFRPPLFSNVMCRWYPADRKNPPGFHEAGPDWERVTAAAIQAKAAVALSALHWLLASQIVKNATVGSGSDLPSPELRKLCVDYIKPATMKMQPATPAIKPATPPTRVLYLNVRGASMLNMDMLTHQPESLT